MKKRFSILFMLLMVTLLVAGCGGGSNSANNGNDTEDTEQSSDNGEQTNQGDSDDSSPVTITAVIKDMSADDEVSVQLLDTISEAVSEQLGREIHIELAPISEGTYSESMGLLLQSGEIPDLMYFQGGDYQFAITQQILEDLTPYIENSTYAKSMMQPFNEERMSNYPYILWLAPDRIKVPVVRNDWFEGSETGEALLQDPSPENYKAFFSELKEQHDLKSAFTVPGDITEMDTIFDKAFGIETSWVKDGDSYIHSKVSQGTKDKLAYYAELYAEGLLDNEWLTQKWDTKESAFYNGEVGVVSGTNGSVVNIYNTKMVSQNGEEAELIVLPPAKGVAQGYTPSDVSKESRGWAISSYSENKDVVFAILEYMASPEGQILDKLGYEGEHYNVDNGEYVLTEKISEWWPRFHESIVGLEANVSEETPYFSKAALDSLDMTQEYASFDNIFVMPEEYITNWDACESLYLEFAADVISGNRSIDEFDDYVKDWNALGGAEITEYANTVLE